MSSEIDSVLYTFGIKKEWVKTNQQKDVLFTKEINIPFDISPVEILYELQTMLLPYSIEINSNEHIESGKISSELLDNKKLLVRLEFIRNSTIKRELVDLCILLKNVDKYSVEEIKDILNHSSYCTVLLPRNLNRIDLQSEIINSRKEYIITFEIGDTEDYEADFRKSQEMKYKINDICNHYQKDKALILFNPKKFYSFEKEIISNLSTCRSLIFSDTLIIDLSSSDNTEKKFSELENKIIEFSKTPKIKKAIMVDVLYTEFEDFIKLLQRFERKGYRYFSFLEYFKIK
ncbi:MAG: hypothetical protein N2490_05300 [Ignavibacteria bacterium]|nr:hypothetical protein [Ignavibacteria bacterium]